MQPPPYTTTLIMMAARSLPELRHFIPIINANASPTQCHCSSQSNLKPKWEEPTKTYLVRNDLSDGKYHAFFRYFLRKQPLVLLTSSDKLSTLPSDIR